MWTTAFSPLACVIALVLALAFVAGCGGGPIESTDDGERAAQANAYEIYVRDNPSDVAGYIELARRYLSRVEPETDRAFALAERCVAANVNNPQAYVGAAEIAGWCGRLDQRAMYLDRALSLAPTDYRVVLLSTSARLELGDAEAALARLTLGRLRLPDSNVLALVHAQLLVEQRRYDEAVIMLDEFLARPMSDDGAGEESDSNPSRADALSNNTPADTSEAPIQAAEDARKTRRQLRLLQCRLYARTPEGLEQATTLAAALADEDATDSEVLQARVWFAVLAGDTIEAGRIAIDVLARTEAPLTRLQAYILMAYVHVLRDDLSPAFAARRRASEIAAQDRGVLLLSYQLYNLTEPDVALEYAEDLRELGSVRDLRNPLIDRERDTAATASLVAAPTQTDTLKAMLAGTISLYALREDEAVAYYGEAANLEPDLNWPKLALANLAVRRGENREAITWFSACLSVENPSPQVYFDIGLCYFGLGEYEEAQLRFDTVVALLEEDTDRPTSHLARQAAVWARTCAKRIEAARDAAAEPLADNEAGGAADNGGANSNAADRNGSNGSNDSNDSNDENRADGSPPSNEPNDANESGNTANTTNRDDDG